MGTILTPKCALPEHLDDDYEWDGKDDDQHFFTKWRKKVKHLFAFGPRCSKGIAFSPFPPFIFVRKWRNVPIVLFADKGGGIYRWEWKDDLKENIGSTDIPSIKESREGWYLSRQQLWCRWSVQLQWPLFFSFHFYFKEKDVIRFGNKSDRDGKLIFFYVGAKRDQDCFWYPAIYLGLNFK